MPISELCLIHRVGRPEPRQRSLALLGDTKMTTDLKTVWAVLIPIRGYATGIGGVGNTQLAAWLDAVGPNDTANSRQAYERSGWWSQQITTKELEEMRGAK